MQATTTTQIGQQGFGPLVISLARRDVGHSDPSEKVIGPALVNLPDDRVAIFVFVLHSICVGQVVQQFRPVAFGSEALFEEMLRRRPIFALQGLERSSGPFRDLWMCISRIGRFVGDYETDKLQLLPCPAQPQSRRT